MHAHDERKRRQEGQDNHTASKPPGARSPSVEQLLELQRTAGNSAVAALLRGAGQEAVQRSTVQDVLRSAGRPLDPGKRAEFETRLGADFSDVRLHDDAGARQSAHELGAAAYTSGSHIVVGGGGLDDHTLAHELTHVVQQRTGPVAGTDTGTGLRVSDPSDAFERAAEENATRVMREPVGAAVETEPVATHTGAVQRALTTDGQPLDRERAKAMVLQTQSAALTPSEQQALDELLESDSTVEVADGVALVRLLRSTLREKWGLNEHEVDLFDRYQGGEYKDWNAALRSGNVRERYQVGQKTTDMIGGLAKTAKTRQRVQRVLSFENRDQFDRYTRSFPAGGVYAAEQFESTTRKLGGELDLPGRAVYVVTLFIEAKGHHGGELSSVINTIKRSEGETVFPPGSRFEVKQAAEQPEDREYTTTAPFRTTIELEELEDLDEDKQKMPSQAEFRKATMAAMLGGGPPKPPGGGGRSKFADMI
ncbi:DUF4157 domain-containing protein [Actinokineospora sp. NBRC 105648]|uniref:eCIS core domain-containing protein n=1 Tax=Actinokineospora sp. NBRC 105648 TaxID=3032206 RepID=UPI0024A587CA|nr:DUF4157 domain-containing protein [Actinokineospora sp. NBRC 105648]GLZ38935.1 hypothetical protein Acsp05_25590 [Actinokineospora sp. NBRC 105648]